MTDAPFISLRGVRKVYGSGGAEFLAVSDVTMDVQEGELVSLVGPSGCGKTTVMKILAGLHGSELGRRSVLVGGADEEDVVADLPPEAGMDVGRQQRAHEIAEMLDAVHIGKGAGDENFGHDCGLSRLGDADRKNQKPSRMIGRAWGRLMPHARGRALIQSGHSPCGRAGAFASGVARSRKSLQILLVPQRYHFGSDNARSAWFGAGPPGRIHGH